MNGGRRYLEFIIFVHFGQMVYFWRRQSTLLQNFIHLCQSAAELLLFVQKSRMAAVAILNCDFVVLDHPRSPLVHLKFPLNFVLIECSGVFRGGTVRRPLLARPWKFFYRRLYMKRCLFCHFPARIAKFNNVWWFLAFPNFRKMGAFAISIEHLEAKSVSASGGLRPLTSRPGALPLDLAGGFAPRPPL